jgi:RND family efflux transporter MFP subunit
MPARVVKALTALFVTGSVIGAGYFGTRGLNLNGLRSDRPLSVPVRKAELRIVVTERGNLESVETIDGICEVQSPTGQVKIIQLVAEGTRVKKGDVVCRFDSADIEKNISQQEIKVKQAQSKVETTEQELEIAKNKAASDVKKAWVDHELAKLDKEKYENADYPIEVDDITSSISQNGSQAETKKNVLDQTRELMRKGFRSPQQLRAAELEYKQFESALKRDQRKKAAKQEYDRKRKNMELTSKVEQTEGDHIRAQGTGKASVAKSASEHVAAKATFEIEDRQLTTYNEQLAKCTITAEQDGVVAYANEPWFDSSRQIREGAQVFNRQKIFSLPDMSRMQVKVSIHESMIKKVKEGQIAEIRVDAFPQLVLRGMVKSVSQLADSNRMWLSGGAKEYSSIITIEKMPEEELRPGMTAEVRIMVRTLSQVMVVPLQAVAEHRGLHYAFVEGKNGAVERREIQVGDSNDKLIQVVSGLAEGDQVLLDARIRADAQFKAEDAEDDGTGPQPGEPAKAPEATSPAETAPAPAPAAVGD